MNDGMGALIVGTILAVGALGFVLYPLFFSVPDRIGRPDPSSTDDGSALAALREIEFDRATGKLSESDYVALRKTYGDLALRELRERRDPQQPEVRSAEPQDAIEARVRAYRRTHRECPACGLRPETDAIYCSTCGGYLDRVCPECSAEVGEASAVFCSSCGASLTRGRLYAVV